MIRRIAVRAPVTAAAVLLGVAVGASLAAFSATSTNSGNTFSVADTLAPTITRVTVAKTDGTADTVRQGGGFYVYAQAADNIALASVTAAVSSFDAGAGTQTLSAGSWTIGGQAYNYRSALLTADTPLYTGTSYGYSVTATDTSSNQATASGSATVQTYSSVIQATSGLVAYWRMGVAPTGWDDFTDTAGTTLQSHTTRLTWTKLTGSDSVITGAGRARRNGTGQSVYYASTAPASADYAVEADLVVKSLDSTDQAGVVARLDTSILTGTYYLARYNVATGAWELALSSLGIVTSLGSYSQTLTVGSTYHLRLQVIGTTVSMWIDGIQRASTLNLSITGAGRGGIRLGGTGSTSVPTDTTGLHLDNFRLVPDTGTTFADSKGSNTGTFGGSPLLNVPGALVGEPTDSATGFNGTSDYGSVPDAAGLHLGDGPLTLEAWVRRHDTASGSHDVFNKGTGAYAFGFSGSDAVLSKVGSGAIATVLGGGSDTTAWHHLVVTKSGSAVKVYRDGVDVTPSLSNQTLTDTATALYIAAQSPTTNLLGADLDELAVYNQVLPAATILDHYNAGMGTG